MFLSLSPSIIQHTSLFLHIPIVSTHHYHLSAPFTYIVPLFHRGSARIPQSALAGSLPVV